MGTISQAQYDVLSQQVKQGGQAARDALSQLSGNTIDSSLPSTPRAVSSPQTSSDNYSSPTPRPSTPSTSLPSWMGNMYKPDAYGYTTNPGNVNSAHYTSSGTPIASIGYSNQQTGVNFQGFGTPEYATMIRNSAFDPMASNNLIQSGLASGQLTPLSASQAYAYGGKQATPQPLTSSTSYKTPQMATFSAKALTPGQQSATDWINNPDSGQGGIANYVNTQQQRYTDALKNNDTELMNRLIADSQRVGYTFSNSDGGTPLSGTPSQYSNPIGGTGGTPNPTPNPTGGSPGATQLPGGGVAPGMPGALTPAQIAAEAAARIAKQRAGISQSVNATKAGLKNAYDYTNQTIADRRSLENNAFKRDNSPFQGNTDYLAADLARTRAQQDTAMDNNYNAAVSAADEKLANFDQMAPEQQAAIMDELTRIERDYGVKVGELTGTYNGQPTAAQANADRTYQLNKDTQQFNQGLQIRQQHIAEANYLSEKYGIQVEPKDDYQLMLDQVKGLPTTAQKTAQQKAASDQKTEAWKVVEILGYVPGQYADILGIPAGTQTQQAKQQAMSAALQERNASTSEKNAQTSADKLAWDKDPNNPQNKPKPSSSTVDPKTSANNYSYYKSQIESKNNITKDQANAYVQGNAANLTDSDYKDLLKWIGNTY